MKFREYTNLKSKILWATQPHKLTDEVNQFGEKNDIIDLQYSSHKAVDGNNVYSVFILYKEEK